MPVLQLGLHFESFGRRGTRVRRQSWCPSPHRSTPPFLFGSKPQSSSTSPSTTTRRGAHLRHREGMVDCHRGWRRHRADIKNLYRAGVGTGHWCCTGSLFGAPDWHRAGTLGPFLGLGPMAIVNLDEDVFATVPVFTGTGTVYNSYSITGGVDTDSAATI